MRHMSDLLGVKELNEKIQYELQEFRQLNYEMFLHEFVRITVSSQSQLKFPIVSSQFSLFSASKCQTKFPTSSSHACHTCAVTGMKFDRMLASLLEFFIIMEESLLTTRNIESNWKPPAARRYRHA